VAVFQCQTPPLVGPIRSARYPDVGILDLLSHPIFLHVGGIQPIVAMVAAANASDHNLFYDGSIIQHPPGRYAPFDTYVSSMAAWHAYGKLQAPPAPVFTYAAAAPVGVTTTSIHLPISNTADETWSWNPIAGLWQLAYSGVPSVQADHTPVLTNNVVVLTVHAYFGPYVENSEGGHEVEFDPLSGGVARVLRNGVMVTGQWQRSALNAPLQLVTAAGVPIALQPGRTWVVLVPDSVPVTTTPAPAATTLP